VNETLELTYSNFKMIHSNFVSLFGSCDAQLLDEPADAFRLDGEIGNSKHFAFLLFGEFLEFVFNLIY